MLGNQIDPLQPRGSRSRRITYHDSVQIAAASPGGLRRWPNASRAEEGIGVATGRENLPPCKALKTHKMRKYSRFCAGPFRGPGFRHGRACPGHPRGSAFMRPKDLADRAPTACERSAPRDDVDGRDKPGHDGMA